MSFDGSDHNLAEYLRFSDSRLKYISVTSIDYAALDYCASITKPTGCPQK